MNSLGEPYFDSVEGVVTQDIPDLPTLWQIIDNRSKFLNFVLLGRYWIDEHARLWEIIDVAKGKPSEIGKIVTLENFLHHCKSYNAQIFPPVPRHDDLCCICGKGWTLEEIDNFDTVIRENKWVAIHSSCKRKFLHDEQVKELKEVFKSVYSLSQIKFVDIEDYNCDNYNSQLIVSTPDGDITIRRINNVIQIEWMENYELFDETLFPKDVYKKGRFINVLSIEEVKKYLLIMVK